MSKHRVHHRCFQSGPFVEQQEARVRLLAERVEIGLSPTTGEPVSPDDDAEFQDGARRSEAQRRKQA